MAAELIAIRKVKYITIGSREIYFQLRHHSESFTLGKLDNDVVKDSLRHSRYDVLLNSFKNDVPVEIHYLKNEGGCVVQDVKTSESRQAYSDSRAHIGGYGASRNNALNVSRIDESGTPGEICSLAHLKFYLTGDSSKDIEVYLTELDKYWQKGLRRIIAQLPFDGIWEPEKQLENWKTLQEIVFHPAIAYWYIDEPHYIENKKRIKMVYQKLRELDEIIPIYIWFEEDESCEDFRQLCDYASLNVYTLLHKHSIGDVNIIRPIQSLIEALTLDEGNITNCAITVQNYEEVAGEDEKRYLNSLEFRFLIFSCFCVGGRGLFIYKLDAPNMRHYDKKLKGEMKNFRKFEKQVSSCDQMISIGGGYWKWIVESARGCFS